VPHFDFEPARRSYQSDREPVTFALCGETFTVLPEPSLGDLFDLRKGPDVDLELKAYDEANPQHLALTELLKNYIGRCIPLEDRPRWEALQYRLRLSEGGLIWSIAQTLLTVGIGFPTALRGSYSSSPPTLGDAANTSTDGTAPSSTPPPGSG
jgi:hypothetical protein